MAKERQGARKARKERKSVPHAVANIHATFNNTIVTFADTSGNVVCWSSGGKIGYKGSRKGTPYAAQLAARNATEQAQDNGVRSVDIRVKGPGPGRESAIRAVAAAGMTITSIRDVTPIPHNGCRPRKRRRV
jgi:small subunit ribosomal protein S11